MAPVKDVEARLHFRAERAGSPSDQEFLTTAIRGVIFKDTTSKLKAVNSVAVSP